MDNKFNNKSNGFENQQKKERYYRTNEQIRGVTEVKLLNEDGTFYGIVTLEKALFVARSNDLDLIEINRNSNPVLCKMMEFGKFKFLEEKRKKEFRSKQTKIELKEIVFRPNTNLHDIETKAKKARELLDDGNKVKICVQMKGRETLHIDVLEQTVQKFLEFVKTYTIENPLTIDGRNAFMIINK